MCLVLALSPGVPWLVVPLVRTQVVLMVWLSRRRVWIRVGGTARGLQRLVSASFGKVVCVLSMFCVVDLTVVWVPLLSGLGYGKPPQMTLVEQWQLSPRCLLMPCS